MIDKEYRQRHWRASLTVMATTLAVTLSPLLLTALFANTLDRFHFLGFPLGFYLAAQGGGVLMMGILFWFVRRQARVDRRHGAAEEI